MKSELATAIIAAIAGVLIAYFVTNIFMGEISPITFKTVDSSVSADLADPDPEVFNYKALNPTVEIYIGADQTEDQTDDQAADQSDDQTDDQSEDQTDTEGTQNQNQSQTQGGSRNGTSN